MWICHFKLNVTLVVIQRREGVNLEGFRRCDVDRCSVERVIFSEANKGVSNSFWPTITRKTDYFSWCCWREIYWIV